MENLAHWQIAAIAIIFVWSGFVRAGLGFGGAVLSLPFLLWIINDPLIFLPIVSIHLLFFSGLVMLRSALKARARGEATRPQVDWSYLTKSLRVMIVPKIIGVMGLVTLPVEIMTSIIFVIVCVYSVSYLLNKPIKSQHRALDNGFLALGGYVSGTSLIAAPLVVAVFATHVAKHQLRDTLFMLWVILVSIKLASFIALDIDLQLQHQLWLLPAAFVGHLLGEWFHSALQQRDPALFYRVLGAALLAVSSLGLARTLM